MRPAAGWAPCPPVLEPCLPVPPLKPHQAPHDAPTPAPGPSASGAAGGGGPQRGWRPRGGQGVEGPSWPCCAPSPLGLLSPLPQEPRPRPPTKEGAPPTSGLGPDTSGSSKPWEQPLPTGALTGGTTPCQVGWGGGTERPSTLAPPAASPGSSAHGAQTGWRGAQPAVTRPASLPPANPQGRRPPHFLP